MSPDLDDPFKSAEGILAACPLGEQADAIIFDFHAEATSEKQCFGHFVDGRASFVVGTHTHVPTADHQILNGGTAYLSDAGMCGDYDSSLGMEKEEPLNRFLSKVPQRPLRGGIRSRDDLRRRRGYFGPDGPGRKYRAAPARPEAQGDRAGVLVLTARQLCR